MSRTRRVIATRSVYAGLGRRTEALREMKIAEEQNPNDQNVHWRLGRFYQEDGKKAEAKAEFDKTRNLQKASDNTVFKKLTEAQAKGQLRQTRYKAFRRTIGCRAISGKPVQIERSTNVLGLLRPDCLRRRG